ncbi:apolipoprotein N-acyltransferase [Leptospira perolatii]|uniref:Apolipoprotein N-acyltransferase n=1 Tax=Leptospira perolatii TaxID=2023191 RepID=A0A2M9ZKT0_9LEPT|nr:apolipoprotein N-acyltransferase [Leptospira perolatii]PJZ69915.1 apolipoprotein N-acyltransferase [Leptospira perolatii]PJZ72677.1 apolipoprotein N-acyltransferase [Leptospira perolatii]
MNSFLSKFHEFQKTKWFDLFCYVWTATLSFLAFSPFYLSHLVWISPFGLFWITHKYSGQYKKLFLHGLLFGIAFYVIAFHWIYHMAVVFGNFPGPIAVIILILAGVLFGAKFPIFLISYSFLSRRINRHSIWVAGFCGLASDMIAPQLFPWYWGNLIAGNILLAQTVEISGVYGLSFLVFVVSYTLFETNLLHLPEILRSKEKTLHFAKFWALPFALLLAFWVVGTGLYFKWKDVKPAKTLEVLVVQPDAPLSFRDGRSVRESIELLMGRIDQLTDAAIRQKGKNPDMIVLPEAGIPFFSAHKTPITTSTVRMYWERFDSLMFLFANRYKANVFFNEIDAGFKKKSSGREYLRYYNNNVMYDQNGERREAYQKQYLVLFGEYMPFEFMYDISPQTGRFEPGESFRLIPYYNSEGAPKLPLPLGWDDTESLSLEAIRKYYEPAKTSISESGSLLPLICYEVILPEFVRKFRDSGNPDFIANLTNDKWYGTTTESDQHFELGRLRSIEWRKWMVRSTNSGISGFVDHLGRFVPGKSTGLMKAETTWEQIQVIPSSPTFYVRFGNLVPWIMLLLTSIYYVNLLIAQLRGQKTITR